MTTAHRETTAHRAQALDALRRADEVRIAGADVRRAVAAGRMTIREALFDPRSAVLRVEQLLRSQRGWGPVRVENALNRANVSGRRRVRELTDRQLYVIALAVRDPKATDRVFNRRNINGGTNAT